MKFLLRGIKSKATAVKGELSSSDYPLYTWKLSGVKAREEVFPILDKSFVKFQRNPVSSGEREGGSLTWRQLHSRAAPGVGMGEPAAPPAIDSRNWNRTRATHSQHNYCTAKISGGFDTVHRVLPRVITEPKKWSIEYASTEPKKFYTLFNCVATKSVSQTLIVFPKRLHREASGYTRATLFNGFFIGYSPNNSISVALPSPADKMTQTTRGFYLQMTIDMNHKGFYL